MAETRSARLRQVSGWAVVVLAAVLAACTGRGEGAGGVRFHAEGQPAQLSDWHLFDVHEGTLVPVEGVLPYDLNTPLFTDYAHKLRTVWMPEGVAAAYKEDETFEFPVGTVISKTFYYPRLPGESSGTDRVLRSEGSEGRLPGGGLRLDDVRLIETRLLVRREEGWVALPYVWNAEQTEARLMRSGDLVPLTLVSADGEEEPATYAVPDQNQCAGCHGVDLQSRTLAPIGPKARHLNRDFDYVDGDGVGLQANQIERWTEMGYLEGAPSLGEVPRVARFHDGSASVEARARSYLDINCSHCHSPSGPGNTSGLWLASDVDEPLRLGRCKLPIAAGHGTGNRQYGIVPGDPDASILTFRMASNDPGVMMPELGRSVVHREGVALIEAWIRQQDGDCDTGG